MFRARVVLVAAIAALVAADLVGGVDSAREASLANLTAQLRSAEPEACCEAAREMARRAATQRNPKHPGPLAGFEEAVPALVRTARDPDANVRLNAVYALGHIADPRAVHPLAACVGDADAKVASAAAAALGEMANHGTPINEAEDVVLKAVARDKRKRVQASAIGVLGWIETDRSRRALLAAVKSKAPHVRGGAVIGLMRRCMRHDDKEAAGALVAATRDDSAVVRRVAVGALGTVGDPVFVPRLIELMGDEAEVRRRAMAALCGIAVPGRHITGTGYMLEARLRKVLPRVAFDRAPLETALGSLARGAGVNLHVNWASLGKAGIKQSTPVTLDEEEVMFGAAVWLVLHKADPSGRAVCKARGNVLLVDTGCTEGPSSGGGPRTEGDKAIAKKLRMPISLAMEDVPLGNVLEFVGEVLGVPVRPRWKVLERAGVGRKALVSAQLKDVPAQDFLDVVLRSVGANTTLDFAVRDGAVIVSTRGDLKR